MCVIFDTKIINIMIIYQLLRDLKNFTFNILFLRLNINYYRFLRDCKRPAEYILRTYASNIK